jgi:hypothetical protein
MPTMTSTKRFERQEAAIKALADAWTALEDKRAALSEAAE